MHRLTVGDVIKFGRVSYEVCKVYIGPLGKGKHDSQELDRTKTEGDHFGEPIKRNFDEEFIESDDKRQDEDLEKAEPE